MGKMVITVYVCLFFYLSVILVSKTLPKDGKIIRPVQKNVILTVRELPFRLSYCLFGSLVPVQMCLNIGKVLLKCNSLHTLICFFERCDKIRIIFICVALTNKGEVSITNVALA
jgi:hypothetical protein